ncbi:MAG: hypothetical protein ABW044_03470 [Cellvibrio sp.]
MNKIFFIAATVCALVAVYFFSLKAPEQKVSSTVDVQAKDIVNPLSVPSAISIPPTSHAEENPAAKNSSSKNIEDRYKAVSDNSRLPRLEQRMEELNQLYPERKFSPDEVVDLLAQRNAWSGASQVPENLPITDKQRKDGRAFIELNPERLQILVPGDSIELPLEKLGMRIQVQMDSREALPDGGFTLHGHVLGSDELMRVTITQGPGLSLVGVDTPQGHVVMQANDTHGWVASSETLFKQDPLKTDAVLPIDE